MAIEQEDRSVFLPLEIIEIVLSKLPGISLLRFKTVSKSWNTIISDPLFVENHRLSDKGSSNLLQTTFLCNPRSGGSLDLIEFDDRILRSVQTLRSPVCFLYNKVRSCDGVVVLPPDNYSKMKFKLWNPSTGTNITCHSDYMLDRPSVLSYGLCHDPTAGVFKFVIICTNYYLVFPDEYGGCSREEFEKDRSGRAMRGSEVTNRCGVSADGVVYWILRRHRRDNVGEIIYFDAGNDKFKTLGKPNNDELFYLTELRGRLCMYRNGRDKTTVRILIKEKGRENNSWKDLITIENVVTPISSFEPKCFVEDKIFILVNGSLVIYTHFGKKFEQVVDVTELYDLVPFIDTPFLLRNY